MNEFSAIDYLEGKITLPGDKSISHRSVMISAIAEGKTHAENFLNSQDCLVTCQALREMGAEIKLDKGRIQIEGKGLRGLKEPSRPLYMGGSGTSLRLILGILAGQKFKATLTADPSLSKRPMKRVTLPLREMGAKIEGREESNFAPLTIEGNDLNPIEYRMPVASAQVKSCLLLAGLYAKGITKVIEPIASRDHTERLLKLMGAKIKKEGLVNAIEGWPQLKARSLVIPGDISSAANFIVLATLAKQSHLIIEKVGLNPTRTGIIDVLKRMGAKIEIKIKGGHDFEPFGDLQIESSQLEATEIESFEIPRLIDELPLLMLAACFAGGKTVIRGAQELRVKETDRINSMVTNLRRLGARIEVEDDVITIEGGFPLKAARVESFCDHRTAMSMVIAGLLVPGKTKIDDTGCIDKSFPEFFTILKKIIRR